MNHRLSTISTNTTSTSIISNQRHFPTTLSRSCLDGPRSSHPATRPWFVAQLGARENYAIADALASDNRLAGLITDSWFSPTSNFNRILGATLKSLTGSRYCATLNEANVWSFNSAAFRFELSSKLRRFGGWELIQRRNQWFQDQACKYLRSRLTPNHIVFTYSYAAKDILQLCREIGCKSVLGQIDPGIEEENIVAAETTRLAGTQTGFERAPDSYWKNWRDECNLADAIMVNSNWSKKALVSVGVPAQKLSVIPLVYSRQNSTDFKRQLPESFSPQRPLEVLFLGQVIPRKGIQFVIEAAKKLTAFPIRFTIVGNPGPWHSVMNDLNSIRVIGRVPRYEVSRYYQQADVFLFPTLSDGFGLTQLEAQRWQLPIICSSNCGQVVSDRHNGLKLTTVSTETVTSALKFVLRHPEQLANWSANSNTDQFGLAELSKQLRQF